MEEIAVTTQAHEGIETQTFYTDIVLTPVTTQAHEGIETLLERAVLILNFGNNSSP